eukprot:3970199-Pyramimonas_sp.AAC.1
MFIQHTSNRTVRLQKLGFPVPNCSCSTAPAPSEVKWQVQNAPPHQTLQDQCHSTEWPVCDWDITFRRQNRHAPNTERRGAAHI